MKRSLTLLARLYLTVKNPFSVRNARYYAGWLGTPHDRTNEWSRAVSDAEKIVGYPTSFMSLRCLLSDEISNVAMQMRKLVGTRHPLLKTARGFVFDGKYGMQTRGLIVLLISKTAGPSPNTGVSQHYTDQDMISGILQSQRALAEITEVIHTANLIHKGVVNLTEVLPEDGSVSDMEFGNKMAVLSGDLLLADACKGLAELNNTKVVENISTAIGDLMEAEFTDLRNIEGKPALPCKVSFSDWLTQTFLSSGSLLANSCLSAMELGNHDSIVKDAAFCFGENMAYAYQLQEDLKPFHDPDQHLQQLTLTSAPVIKCVSQSQDTSVENTDYRKIVDMVRDSGVMDECVDLCEEFSNKAIMSLSNFPSSDAKNALVNMVNATKVL